jgi:anaphase-promoting complex subunit 8
MQKLGNCDHAAVLYKEYVAECEATEQGDKGELCRAYKFLAAYHIKTNELNDAYHFAQKCLGYEEVSSNTFY